MAAEFNDAAACRAVVVTALNSTARGWWERLGFNPFDPHAGQIDLYLLTADIDATLQRLQ